MKVSPNIANGTWILLQKSFVIENSFTWMRLFENSCLIEKIRESISPIKILITINYRNIFLHCVLETQEWEHKIYQGYFLRKVKMKQKTKVTNDIFLFTQKHTLFNKTTQFEIDGPYIKALTTCLCLSASESCLRRSQCIVKIISVLYLLLM